MPTFQNTTFASFFKRIFQVSQASNAGVDATTRNVQTGDGVNTSISISDDVLQVQPQNDDTTTTLDVKTSGGTSILTADTTNKRILCGSSQVNALTMYQVFNSFNLVPTAGHHEILSLGGAPFSSDGLTEIGLADGTNPATSLDVSAEAGESNNLVPCYWYLPDAITIMAAHVLMGGSSATNSTLNFHLMSYDIDTSSNYGDLSNGVVVADSGVTTGVDEDVIKVNTMTNLPTDVAAGKVILATVESGGTSALSIQMIVKYHIQ